MKKRLIFIITLALTAALFIGGCSSEEKDSGTTGESTDTGDTKFVVGLDDSIPPMGFRDESGELVGIDIDLAKATAEEMGMEVEFKAVNWDTVVLSLKKGDIDVVWNGFTVTEDRKKEVNFTDTYLNNRQIMIVKADSDIKVKEDLKGKILGLQLGSSSEEALNNFEEFKNSLSEVSKYDNNVEALMDLDAGRVEAVLVDETVGKYYMSKKEDAYRILEEDLGVEEYGVGLRKDDNEFYEKLNEALKKVKNSEKGKEISEKWFGEDILVK